MEAIDGPYQFGMGAKEEPINDLRVNARHTEA